MPTGETIEWWLHFSDREADDRAPGPARAVKVAGRCVKCWGPASGRENADDLLRIECDLCGRSVDGDAAARERTAMREEMAANLPRARMGCGANYREQAAFLLKLLPDMDRDKQAVDDRIDAARKSAPQRNRLSRQKIPPGSAGHLYGQARAMMSGVETLPRDTSAISLSDIEFGEPHVTHVEESPVDGSVSLCGQVPASYRKPPSERESMARMGATMLGGMAAAFSCELGMKAVLMTRLDEAPKTHDLLELYEALPPDSRARLEADFPEIGEVMERHRGTFGEWRYFGQTDDGAAFTALVNTDRASELGKAARVVLDECIVSGLTFGVDITATFAFDRGVGGSQQHYRIEARGGESAIPWAAVLDAPC